MKIVGSAYLNKLTAEAGGNLSKLQHRNIRYSYQDLCRRLFNAIDIGSYNRLHRHATDLRDKLLFVVRFGSSRCGEDLTIGAEIPASTYHTLTALEPGCILLEVKTGPFDPNQSKDLAPWAPDKHSSAAVAGYVGLSNAMPLAKHNEVMAMLSAKQSPIILYSTKRHIGFEFC